MTTTLPLTEEHLSKLNGGDLVRPDQLLGAHVTQQGGVTGVRFAVWAPNARHVSLVGDFNGWNPFSHPMSHPNGGWGFWSIFVPEAQHGQTYKYAITGPNGQTVWKADPYATTSELRPKTASVIWQDQPYFWGDDDWMSTRDQGTKTPISIYEVHLASWMRREDNWYLNYRELAPLLADYVAGLNYTHVELMGVMEHPFDGSWGYQVTGYYAPTSRFGTPEDFKFFVDVLHQRGIGVLLDWVPGHFPTDEIGLANFDGSPLYEYADPRKGFHPDWNTYVFDYGRNEVIMFLIGSALRWLEDYHVDGLRVDAVASMLYLDFSRNEGAWIPNIHGGRENLEAIAFFKRLNSVVHHRAPGAIVVAEESTSFPGVTAPEGLDFDYKWAMGWMNDTLAYMAEDPIYRQYDHHKLTFFDVYRTTEKFVLAVSHDEVVHLKHSLVTKMPGSWYEQRAGLRAFLGLQWTMPGKKLLFMGQEFAQRDEWNHDQSLPWYVLDYPEHRGVHDWVRDLNALYRSHPALYASDHTEDGLAWIAANDTKTSVYAYLRRDEDSGKWLLVVLNMTPVYRPGYWIGVPESGTYSVLLNSDAGEYGGFGTMQDDLSTCPEEAHGQPQHLKLNLAPNSVLVLELL
ncbi:1,4-alpha-glucan branching protein GlgB [Deinococcus ruber]|uniref:1,4-alpha-glucan branching enzyme GlgB n=1 Tax=Deinococcus ruber TaxID=1848197 RepID=A0A918C019_9DEIO|nr:1,4-alpha-glucan branching protein GlgB [Deinococcus ruber]GGQ98851.1 1,4-alpha-glucan branching enzyme GlgB [Deinococcus ruber]